MCLISMPQAAPASTCVMNPKLVQVVLAGLRLVLAQRRHKLLGESLMICFAQQDA
jgi:hypothetical protein